MNTSTSDFKNLIKKEAEQLFIAFKIAMRSSDSILTSEPCFSTPSLQQCYEIISQAYGFNSYNGLLNAPSNHDSSFDTKKLNDSLLRFFLQVNINEASGVCNMIELMVDIDVLANLIEDVNSISFLISGFPSLMSFKLPKRFYIDEFLIDGKDDSQEHTAIWMLSLLVEMIDSLDHHTRRNSVVYAVPLNCIYQHKFSDINKVRDIVIDLEDLLNRSGLLSVSMGEFDLTEYNLSKVHFSVSLELSDHLRTISNLIRNERVATSRLKSVLDQFGHQDSNSFNNTAYMLKSPLKRISGSDIVKYKLNSFFFFSVYINHVCEMLGIFISYVNPYSFPRIFVCEDSYIEEALAQFTEKYQISVLPFIDEYMQHQEYVLNRLKPLLSDFPSGKLGPSISNVLKEELSSLKYKINDMVFEMRPKLMSEDLKRRIEELTDSVRVR